MLSVEYILDLEPKRREQLMNRSTVDSSETMISIREIIARLLKDAPQELEREYGAFKSDLKMTDFKVSSEEISEAYQKVSPKVLEALKIAVENVTSFHKSQLERPMWITEVAPGLLAGRITKALDTVGVYIPGGRAAYPSSAIMNLAPAKAAGVRRLIATTPPNDEFKAHPEILVAADLAGADEIYKLGGPWAIASLAYGLGCVPKVHKIVGPGSKWVTAAKMAVFGEVDIDMPAGPSEGFIIADHTAKANHVAWDLLSQLEHDPDAAAILVTTDRALAEKVVTLVLKILPTIARQEIITESLKKAAAVLVAQSLDEAIKLSNEYAPEHLQIITEEPWAVLTKIKNAGSIFLGEHATIACGDYATGTNHVLPTGGAAWMFSGLSVDSFLKKMTFQHLTKDGLANLGPTVITLAQAEGFLAHAEAVRVRLNDK